jgi:glycerophosphoryl diester phosphodiesterase
MKTYSDNPLIDLIDRERINHRIPLLIAHRGGVVSPKSPENSLAAIKLAGDGSYDMVEIDIAEAKDCEPVLFHGWNGNLRLDCGLDAFVYELSGDELIKVQYRESDQCIASLSQALKLCRELDLGVMLDIKEYGPHHTDKFFLRIAQLLLKYELSNASLTFSQNPLGYKNLRDVIKFAISEDELVLFTNGQRNIAEGRWWFALPDEVTRQLVIDLQENGALVIVAINQFRYPTHAHEVLANRDIKRLIETSVDGLQIDSIYEGLIDPFLDER